MIFVDASGLIAIIAGEPDADALADLLETERQLCFPRHPITHSRRPKSLRATRRRAA
jgi:uncharacterized protein with PIN domain